MYNLELNSCVYQCSFYYFTGNVTLPDLGKSGVHGVEKPRCEDNVSLYFGCFGEEKCIFFFFTTNLW
jgi:hypothetical protein